MMASIDQILRQGSSIFHSASPLEEIQLSSSVNQFREPTIDVSSATASLTPILHSPRKEIATPTFSRTVGDEKNFTGKPTYLFLERAEDPEPAVPQIGAPRTDAIGAVTCTVADRASSSGGPLAGREAAGQEGVTLEKSASKKARVE
ncbi:hypothetical protein Bca52824_011398 [Brassica carinata]|uniref:Uncharacterized protein n=1 Tax=Brassica carinata TaxID=52824 RepID=A0A8X7WG78_BRACI|nr:hypothetical protein Bca52824_011398 [Brassica carinata]